MSKVKPGNKLEINNPESNLGVDDLPSVEAEEEVKQAPPTETTVKSEMLDNRYLDA